MKTMMGIDLGSTTCKAIVLTDEGKILGKGITNTRNNYTMATKIASHEALTNARFSMLSHEAGLSPEEQQDYEVLYHQADYLHKHKALNRRMRTLAEEQKKNGKWRGLIEEMGQHVSKNFMADETRKDIADRAKFFKDIAYGFYLDAIKEFLPGKGPETETFMAYLDKALVYVENEMFPLEPEDVLGDFLPEDKQYLVEELKNEKLDIAVQSGTGYGRQLLPFPEEQIRSEILCHAKGAYYFFPHTRTVLDIGGQDTKAIQLGDKGVVRSFFMNDRCAAGCGRYLGYVAEELAIGLSDLGPTACNACRHVPITSTCTVFAGAELRDLLYAGEKDEEILLGLHRAIVLRAMSLLARSGGIEEQFTFTGGVANNIAVVKVLKELVHKNYGEVTLNIHPDSIYMGALGAALYAKESLC
ncbi:MAG: benzoyl-CoA reductase subunit A [bacterium]|nr:benzoyl-CoA reductase subunit A [bacterium]